jgi:hypothetical protein
MGETRAYAEMAQRFARLAAEATSEAERDGYRGLAAAYLQLAKDAAHVEVRAMAAPGTHWAAQD